MGHGVFFFSFLLSSFSFFFCLFFEFLGFHGHNRPGGKEGKPSKRRPPEKGDSPCNRYPARVRPHVGVLGTHAACRFVMAALVFRFFLLTGGMKKASGGRGQRRGTDRIFWTTFLGQTRRFGACFCTGCRACRFDFASGWRLSVVGWLGDCRFTVVGLSAAASALRGRAGLEDRRIYGWPLYCMYIYRGALSPSRRAENGGRFPPGTGRHE